MNNMNKQFLLLIYDLQCGGKQNVDLALTGP